jgi:hypothetical protein
MRIDLKHEGAINPSAGRTHAHRRAVLCCAVLCCAVLCCAVLCCAVLCCAVLCCAVLCCAVPCEAQCVRCLGWWLGLVLGWHNYYSYLGEVVHCRFSLGHLFLGAHLDRGRRFPYKKTTQFVIRRADQSAKQPSKRADRRTKGERVWATLASHSQPGSQRWSSTHLSSAAST